MRGRWAPAMLLAALIAGASLPASAQMLAAPPQVLTLDQDRLYSESRYGKAVEARLMAENQTLATENRKIEAELATAEADLTKRRATMTPTAFQTLADAFDARVEQARRDQAAKVEALKAREDAARKDFFQAAIPVLADLMRQMGAYAILNHDAVVLSFDNIDVTSRAISALDDKLGDGSSAGMGPRLPDPAPRTAIPATP
jgi:Skp family chaperone for outer membrane proteins